MTGRDNHPGAGAGSTSVTDGGTDGPAARAPPNGDVAVVGAGRIGLPWAAVLAADLGRTVTCVDVDPDRVAEIEAAESPFPEPGLAECIERGRETGRLQATTDPSAVADHGYVAFTVNAPRNQMSAFLDVVDEYAQYLSADQVVLNRVTVPVDVIRRMRELLTDRVDPAPSFVCFPERLAEGKAIGEIRTLPKVVGVDDARGEAAMRELLVGFDCDIQFTDPETAMFVKLIDNSYRDALFAISNQIAYTADQLGLDAHEAIGLANHEYPRNDIPSPGTVGGKCLPKDPHFLTDERVCDQPSTPDLFTATRRTNAQIPGYVVTKLLRHQPAKVGILGLTYKAGVADTYNSPAADIYDQLDSVGVEVAGHDPNVAGTPTTEETLRDADLVVLAVPHGEYEGIEPRIEALTRTDATVYDVWGVLDAEGVDRAYEGFGIRRRPAETDADVGAGSDDPDGTRARESAGPTEGDAASTVPATDAEDD